MAARKSQALPRSEYPRPQFRRPDWLCLNGEWEFEIDTGDSGLERGLKDRPLAQQIVVPFCPEAPLSGIGNPDYLNAVWYRRTVRLPAEWRGRAARLHFQAVDYDATVWVNGVQVGRHRGGFSPFSCDLAGVAAPGEEAVIVVRARDDHREPKPMGKQSWLYANLGCSYTRTTGIWQSVWLEPLPESHLTRPRITPDVENSRFLINLRVEGVQAGLKVRAVLRDAQGEVTAAETKLGCDFSALLILDIPAGRVRLWGPEDPHLYGLDLVLLDASGRELDRAESYAGLRSVTVDGRRMLLNGRPVFQRQVLDQGYYLDGIMTAPSEEALIMDIELSLAAGFNSARLHQKVFEERFLYHADRLGYLVWGEFGDWGAGRRHCDDQPQREYSSFVAQWLEVLARDYSHPCIVGWCPMNETHDRPDDHVHTHDEAMKALFLATKAFDQSRPVLDTSGYSHRVSESDIYDCHDYTQKPDELVAHHAKLAEGQPFINDAATIKSVAFKGQPYFVSEFGGIRWAPQEQESRESWGYGESPRTLDEFYARFKGLCDALLDHPLMFGYCYTQLTDVFQEQNGLYFFDRRPKFDLAKLKAIQSRPAAYEQTGG